MHKTKRNRTILAMFEQGRSVPRIAAAVACGTATVYRVLARDPDLSSSARKQGRDRSIVAMCKRGCGVQKIVAALGSSQATVYRVLRRNPQLRAGRATYPTSTKRKRDRRIIAMRNRGYTFREIAQRVQCSSATTQNVMNRNAPRQLRRKPRKPHARRNHHTVAARRQAQRSHARTASG
jgi:Mor family transcriptional regulator